MLHCIIIKNNIVLSLYFFIYPACWTIICIFTCSSGYASRSYQKII